MRNKKWLAVLASMAIATAAKAVDAPRIPIPAAIESEVKTLGCDSCHGWTRTKFGPAWQDVADRYRGRTTYVYKGFEIDGPGESLPLVAGLVKKVSKGGKGEWNEFIPMVPNDPKGNNVAGITEIVNFILSIPAK